MYGSRSIVRRNGSTGKLGNVLGCAANEEQKHMFTHDIERTEADIFDERSEPEHFLVERFCPLEVIHMNFPSAINALGIKGVGESGVISPAAAVANAVEDALADYGIEIDRPPVTAARVFELLRATEHWPAR